MVNFGINNKKINKEAQGPGPSYGDNVVTATSYIGVKASDSFNNGEVTETELYKTQVEHEGRLRAGVNAAEEYLDDLKENAKVPFKKAGQALKDTAEKAESYVQDSASSLKNKVSESEQQASDKARRLASDSADKIKQIPDQVETAAVKSYYGLSSLVPYRLKLARDDLSRSWSRFTSKLYTSVNERPRTPKDPIQDFVRQMTRGKKPGYDVKHIVNTIRDVLQDKGENFADGVQSAYEAAKDKGEDLADGIKGTYQAAKDKGGDLADGVKGTYQSAKDKGGDLADGVKGTYQSAKGKGEDLADGVKGTYQSAKDKVVGASDFDTISEALNQAPSNVSPRDFWRSVYNHLDHHNHPLAAPISSFSYSPVPVTSLYLGLFTFSVAYSFSRRSALALSIPKNPKEKSPEVVVVKSNSILNHVAEHYAWAPMTFFNILLLELNGYSAFTVFSIALASLFGQLASQYSLHASTQEYAKFATVGVVFLSAFLNTFSAITGSPVF